jgi:hypothetical protein
MCLYDDWIPLNAASLLYCPCSLGNAAVSGLDFRNLRFIRLLGIYRLLLYAASAPSSCPGIRQSVLALCFDDSGHSASTSQLLFTISEMTQKQYQSKSMTTPTMAEVSSLRPSKVQPRKVERNYLDDVNSPLLADPRFSDVTGTPYMSVYRTRGQRS